jgi:hypothetical protein
VAAAAELATVRAANAMTGPGCVVRPELSEGPYFLDLQRNVMNSADGIYRNGAEQLLLTPVAANGGYAAALAIALDLSDTATGRAVGRKGTWLSGVVFFEAAPCAKQPASPAPFA